MTEMLVPRRIVLKSAAGALVVGVTVPGFIRGAAAQDAAAATQAAPMIGGFVRIGADNTVTVMIPSAEMGQGTNTSLAMIVADELGCDWSMVRAEAAPVGEIYRNPGFGMQGTGGSTSVRMWYDPLRKAAAVARAMLVTAAATKWGVSAAGCTVENGTVKHADSGYSASFGSLAARAAALEAPAEGTLRPNDELKLIGQPVKRLDTPAKTDGSAVFGIDVKVPDMAYGAVRQSPVFGAGVAAINRDSIMTMPGVIDVVEVPGAAVVVADSTWHARMAAEALDITFAATDFDKTSSAEILAGFQAHFADAEAPVAKAVGDAPAALAGAAKTITADYAVPFLAHATMEPMNCTASVTAEGCDIWAPTQAQDPAVLTAAALTGLDPSAIRVHTTFLGGGFGRRFEVDFITHAVLASKAVGRPVKVVWSREEDMQHDFYRPAAVSRFSAGFDADGKVVAVHNRIVGPSIMTRVFPQFVANGIDETSVEGSSTTRYAFPNFLVDYVKADTHVPVGFWRSVGNSYNAFFIESFVDEIAHEAGVDPLEMRRTLLAEDPRALNVVNTAAEKAGWGTELPAGRFRGLAFHESFGSLVAEVVEISIEAGAPRVHRVVCAVDCGRVINPDTVAAQIESGIVYGLAAALRGEITIDQGRVVQSNFHDYEMLMMAEMPVIETHIIESGEALGGIGEPSTPPVAPALANAIFAATGTRIRTLPIRNTQLG